MPSVARRAKDGRVPFSLATNGRPSESEPALFTWHSGACPLRLVAQRLDMYYVYLLRSESSPEQVYIGFTEDLRQRLAEHNAGKSTHTRRYAMVA